MSGAELDGASTRKRRGRPKGWLAPKTLAIRETVLDELVPKYNKMTVRQVFYALSVLGIVAKEESGYRAVQVQLTTMRRDGLLPWDFIADGTRLMRMNDHWSDVSDFLEDVQQAYRRDLWRGQGVRIEIWLEKDALGEIVFEITNHWRVPLMVSRGQSSVTFLHTAAMEARRAYDYDDTETFVYALYDYDAGGDRASRAVARDLPNFAGADVPIHFERLAVTAEQIEDWSLPSRPPKPKDPEAGKWGNKPAVELDAIPVDLLHGVVEDAILRHISARDWDVQKAIEAEERNGLTALIEAQREENDL